MDHATRDAFRNAAEQPHRIKHDVLVPTIGTVSIRSLTAREHAQIESMILRQRNGEALAAAYAKLLTMCVLDNSGGPMFGPADSGMLMRLDNAIQGPLVQECMDHCGIVQSDLEAMAGNSETTRSAATPTV